MTSKQWSLIKSKDNGDPIDFLYQVYCTKYNDLDKFNFEKNLHSYMRFHNFTAETLKQRTIQKYDGRF